MVSIQQTLEPPRAGLVGGDLPTLPVSHTTVRVTVMAAGPA